MRNNKYSHIESFEDLENEKMRLYFKMRLTERKLEIKYIEFSQMLNPLRFMPLIISQLLSPFVGSIKDFIVDTFFRKKEEKKTTNSSAEKCE